MDKKLKEARQRQPALSQRMRNQPLPFGNLFDDAERHDLVIKGNLPIFPGRVRKSTVPKSWPSEPFYSDKSRITFCSSFRRMMQKAQVFSLEANESVRNRLTHSLEVADIGRTLARKVGRLLEKNAIATPEETECMQSIVENACLIHDIGNPAFGHFGEEAVKKWFQKTAAPILKGMRKDELPGIDFSPESHLYDFLNFDGNPQGFRIATHLHFDVDEFSLNLTYSTLLASVKYPNAGFVPKDAIFPKKLGIFSSEREVYNTICAQCGVGPGRRYFLAYLMELADDICYCLSDIADSFEKGVTNSREFKDEFADICKDHGIDSKMVLPKEPIRNFAYQMSIPIARRVIDEASKHFAKNIEEYLAGAAPELSEALPSGKVLKCFKTFARRFIYTHTEAQRIEIAGARIMEGLLDHFGTLLKLSREDFIHFVEQNEMRKGSGLDTEWRIFNQLSKRMLKVYRHCVKGGTSDADEWICRARLIVDYVSGLTDTSALRFYQNHMGISL